MANTLTGLIPDIFKAKDVVSKEAVAILSAVSIDNNLERVAKNQTIRSFTAPTVAAADFTPGQQAPNSGDQTIGFVDMAITHERYVPIRWNGNDEREVENSFGMKTIFQQQLEQAMRTLRNELEAAVTALHIKASRAQSPNGTDLFDASNTVYKDVADVRKILVDNGAPLSDLHLILGTTTGARLRGNPQYAGANTAGREDIQRTGVLADLSGFAIAESAQIVENFTEGTASGAKTDNAGYAVGATTLTLGSDGTGTLLAGDVITLAGDTNEYVLVSGDADVSDGGTIVLAAPGLKVAITTAQVAITVVSSAERNMAFSRNAIHVATRGLPIPSRGDAAFDSMFITDPLSGVNYELREYREFGQNVMILGHSYGVKMIKPEHCALLID